MKRIDATVATLVWQLLCLNFIVLNGLYGIEGRMLPSGGFLDQGDPDCEHRPDVLPPIRCQNPGTTLTTKGLARHTVKVFGPCKYTWQLPATDCWPPIGQSPRCDHLHNEDCGPSPPTTTHVTIDTAPWTDPECEPKPGHLPLIHCQNPGTTLATEGLTRQTAKVFEPCKYNWQLPARDCWPPIGQSPHCDHLHNEGCGPSPPTTTHVTRNNTAPWTDPECEPKPGHLPPIHCQNPGTTLATEGMTHQTAKVFEPCKYTWQLPATDCWPPIGQSPHCDHLHNEDCGPSPPTTSHDNTTPWTDPECESKPGHLPPIHCEDPL